MKKCNNCIFPKLSIYKIGRAYKCYLTDKYHNGVVICSFIGGIRNFDVVHYSDYSYNYHFYEGVSTNRKRTNDKNYYEYMLIFLEPESKLKQFQIKLA